MPVKISQMTKVPLLNSTARVEISQDGVTYYMDYVQLLQKLSADLQVIFEPIFGGGGGGGGTQGFAPVMPDTEAFTVPNGRPDGAVIAYVTPLNAGVPAPTFTMTPVAGLDIMPATGDVYITDAVTLHAALVANPISFTVTATNTEGFDSTTVTISAGVDYLDLPSANAANLVMDFDVYDNRQVQLNPLTVSQAIGIKDKSPELRHARNELHMIGYVMNSQFGIGKPALRGDGQTGPTTGLYFQQNPIWQGIRVANVSTNTLNDVITILMDQMYKNGTLGSPNESALEDVRLLFPKGTLLLGPSLVTVIVNGPTLRYRLNGVDVGTLTLASYNQPQYPTIGFFLFSCAAITGSGSLISVSALGQGRSWKGTAINGDIGRIIQYLNATDVSVPPVDPNPPPVTNSDLTKEFHAVSAADAASYTFAAQAFGAADAARQIIVGITYRASGAPTVLSITIGGIDAVIDVESRNTSNNLSSALFARATVPTGTTGDVVVTLSAAAVLMGITGYRTTRYTGAAPTKTVAATRPNTNGIIDLTLLNPDQGFQLACATSYGGTNRRHTSAHSVDSAVSAITVDCLNNGDTWTGLTEDTGVACEAGNLVPMAGVAVGFKFP